MNKSSTIQKIITAVVDESEKGDTDDFFGWGGPSGKIWCSECNKYIDPMNEEEMRKCPECQTTFANDTTTYRYLRLR